MRITHDPRFRGAQARRNRVVSMMSQGPLVLPSVIGADPIEICAFEPWMQRAACTEVDPELFYPEQGEYVRSRAAKRICASCPVREECLQFAIANHEPYGIWGGLSIKERRVSA